MQENAAPQLYTNRPCQVTACLPKGRWRVRPADLACRRDLRGARIFSIDPPTARDLDDALSIEAQSDGTWRVGVHIADVSHFVQCVGGRGQGCAWGGLAQRLPTRGGDARCLCCTWSGLICG